MFFLNTETPSSTFSPIGFPEKFENIAKVLNFFLTSKITFLVISRFIRSLSVTNNGLDISKFLQASDKSLILFSPTHTEVG